MAEIANFPTTLASHSIPFAMNSGPQITRHRSSSKGPASFRLQSASVRFQIAPSWDHLTIPKTRVCNLCHHGQGTPCAGVFLRKCRRMELFPVDDV
eukprot:scaffold150860_cov17-Tisochrysis_lutea.AAC.1